MKVAHVINTLNRGGAESHLLELVKAQSNTGLTTDVIVIGEDSSDILSIKKELSSVCRKIYRFSILGNFFFQLDQKQPGILCCHFRILHIERSLLHHGVRN